MLLYCEVYRYFLHTLSTRIDFKHNRNKTTHINNLEHTMEHECCHLYVTMHKGKKLKLYER